jgi:hypothetical protein
VLTRGGRGRDPVLGHTSVTSVSDPHISTTLDLHACEANVTASRKIWFADPGPNPLAPIIPADLPLAGTGSTVTAPIAPATATIWVLDTYTLVSIAPALDNVKNRFATPGPLLLAGLFCATLRPQLLPGD